MLVSVNDTGRGCDFDSMKCMAEVHTEVEKTAGHVCLGTCTNYWYIKQVTTAPLLIESYSQVFIEEYDLRRSSDHGCTFILLYFINNWFYFIITCIYVRISKLKIRFRSEFGDFYKMDSRSKKGDMIGHLELVSLDGCLVRWTYLMFGDVAGWLG